MLLCFLDLMFYSEKLQNKSCCGIIKSSLGDDYGSMLLYGCYMC